GGGGWGGGRGCGGRGGHWGGGGGGRVAAGRRSGGLSEGVGCAGAKHGPQSTAFAEGFAVQNPYESTTARTLERMANMALERNMARPPTVTINQGTMINVYVAQDVDFTAVLR